MTLPLSGAMPIVVAYWVAPLLQPSSADPFFSNDAVGFIKVLVFFAGIAAIVVATIVKISSSGLKNDLTNLGQKVDAQTRAYDKDIARLDAQIVGVEKDMEDTTRDITTLITATAGENTKQMTELQVELARMQERDRLAEQIGRLRAEIREDFRGRGPRNP